MGKLVIKPKGVVHISYNGTGSGGGSTLGDPAMLKFVVDNNNNPFSYSVFERGKFPVEFLNAGGSPACDSITYGEYFPQNYDEHWDAYVDYPAVPSGCVVYIEPIVPPDASFSWEDFVIEISDPLPSGGGGGGSEPVV